MDNNKGNKENGSPKNIFDLVGSLASKFDGKSSDELLSAIYVEAKRGKKNGTLSNNDIDNFMSAILPFLDEKKAGMLKRVCESIKRL